MLTGYAKWVVLSIALFFPTIQSLAEIEKYALTCETGMCFYWWPKLKKVQGWHHDREHSYTYSVNAQAPDGYTFANAESVIYAKSLYKPRIPETKNLFQLIKADHKTFMSKRDVVITEVAPIKTADGQALKSYTFFPKANGDWEQVSYGEEGDYYLVFTISSRSELGYRKSQSAYKQFISTYHK